MNKAAYGQQRGGEAASGHRFRVGDTVSLAQGYGYAQRSGALYEVVALLPSDRAHFQYRIRSATEAFERVAAENQLIAQASAKPASAQTVQRPGARFAISAARRRSAR